MIFFIKTSYEWVQTWRMNVTFVWQTCNRLQSPQFDICAKWKCDQDEPCWNYDIVICRMSPSHKLDTAEQAARSARHRRRSVSYIFISGLWNFGWQKLLILFSTNKEEQKCNSDWFKVHVLEYLLIGMGRYRRVRAQSIRSLWRSIYARQLL